MTGNMLTALGLDWRAFLASREFAKVPKPADGIEWGLLAKEALEVARGEVGKGESGGNNLGPDVARYCAPANLPQNWCGGFVGWCYEQAAIKRGLTLPFRRSLGAKQLGRRIGAVGKVFEDPKQAAPGDVIVWHRGAHGSWMGHIGLVAEYRADADRLFTIEGNKKPIVRVFSYGFAWRERFAFFASLRGG